MSWPTPQDYNEAIQNPRLAFADPELAAGSPELTALGLPRPVTGNFASVYRLHCAGRDWAVRCFWREYADMAERYDAISRHLQAAHLPWTVPFVYLPDGIKIRGVSYPILKMEWVEGETLGAWVEQHRRDAAALCRFAERWRELVGGLTAAGIAHGDLQHGNVLVVGGEPRLVDYDAMFVPALGGRGSHELGHPHYQHPRRAAADFAPWIDRFSARVIDLSLRALAGRPELWDELDGGDECLVLRRADYLDPAASRAFALLAAHPDEGVRRLTAEIRSALAAALPSVAPLPARATTSGRKSRKSFPSPPGGGPAWLADHLPAPAPWRPETSRPRTLALASLVVGVAAASADLLLHGPVATAVLLAPGVVMTDAAGFFALFAFEPRASQRLLRQREAWLEARAWRRTARELERVRAEKMRALERLDRRLVSLSGKRAAIAGEERQERETLNAMLAAELHVLQEDRRDLTARERADIERRLEHHRSEHRRRVLRSHRLGLTPLPGMSRPALLRLLAARVFTAADVTPEVLKRVTAGDEAAGMALAVWATAAEREARAGMPTTLPGEELAGLSTRYGRERDALQARERALREEAARLEAALAARYTRRFLPADAEIRRIEAARTAATREWAEREQAANRRCEEASARLSRVHRALEICADVTFARYLRAVFLP